MAFHPKTEPGSLPMFIPTTDKKEYCEMSISELVSVLRIAFKIEDFDKIEQELVQREAKLRAEIGRLQEKIELERLQGIEFEERLKIREEQCERGKRAQENYEQLLKEVKTNSWIEKHAIEELRRKNVALEREVCELKEFKKIMLDDVNSADELRDKIRVLKEEKVGDKNALDVLNMKNIELEEAVKKNLTLIEGLRNENAKLADEKVGDKNALDVLNMKNIELKEAVKKNLTVIEGLMNENAKLKDEKHELKTVFESLEKRYNKLRVSYAKVEESTHCSVDTGNAQSPKKGNKEDAVGALGVKFKLEKVIVDLGDDDNDARCTSQGLREEQIISQKIAEKHLQRVEMIKRQRASDIQASTSTFTSSADLFEKENLPVKKSVMGKDIQSPAEKKRKGYRAYRAQRVSGPNEPLAHELKHGSKLRVYVRKKQSFLS
ncbi:filament-like plant protein 2 isoform X2 [Vigna radiata var. radiata]|uniref:Filament-like plant protein 2 isoform X2 n=1 Tax=Vigna radiata var. radiata TaxID=3916 RepID=A0A1S3UDH5_VIGRR|nr:filament-like plant protein 2 isoform X2 [Vigna radiata var. radiata]